MVIGVTSQYSTKAMLKEVSDLEQHAVYLAGPNVFLHCMLYVNVAPPLESLVERCFSSPYTVDMAENDNKTLLT